MPAQRKLKSDKQHKGTLRKSREAKRAAKTSNPQSELEDAREALAAMRQNLRLSTAELAARGLLIKTAVLDHHGKATVAERINPAVRVQREALKSIASLKKQIAVLEEEAREREDEDDALDGLDDITKGLDGLK
jgi:hypothetical protein